MLEQVEGKGLSRAGMGRAGPGCVVHDPRSLLSPPPTPTRLDATSRSTVIRTDCSWAAGPGPGRASPVPATTFRTFHVHYAGGFIGAALPGSSRLPWPSPCYSGLGSPLSPHGVGLTTRQTSLHAADRTVAPSNEAFDAGRRRRAFPPDAASLLPGSLVTTRTGLSPVGGDELASPHDQVINTHLRSDRARPLDTQ